ncbi:LysR family transcriptional regulator [Dyella halodurans]|uniref:LysR family transcriptional regulator n=1 Tax=Dyella halodurans TaxID=1920171 RepID=A0ABV9C2V1_9GAMM|nr:LysR family transcriptional regulator [Dyella halodurans]
MLDAVTLDQLRTFIAAAEEGSFSAAGRKLRRAQSVVSQTLLNLEAQLGVTLFDRSERYPRLTEAGVALLAEARGVADQMDGFKAHARSMKEGLEPELSVAVDVMYPMDGLTRAAGYCRESFPNTPLRVFVEALGGVIQPVMDGVCRIGIVGSLPVIPDELASEPLIDLPLVTVVAPSHPLAKHKGAIGSRYFEKQVQLVLTDRTSLSEGRTFGVLSPLTWHLADLGAKHAFLAAGLGWGHMPLPMVKKDLDAGTLVRIRIEGLPRESFLPMHVVYRKDVLPGPAGRAFISQLRC